MIYSSARLLGGVACHDFAPTYFITIKGHVFSKKIAQHTTPIATKISSSQLFSSVHAASSTWFRLSSSMKSHCETNSETFLIDDIPSRTSRTVRLASCWYRFNLPSCRFFVEYIWIDLRLIRDHPNTSPWMAWGSHCLSAPLDDLVVLRIILRVVVAPCGGIR